MHTIVFDALWISDKKEAETAGEEMLYAMLYLEILNKAKFADLNALNKEEYTRTITAE